MSSFTTYNMRTRKVPTQLLPYGVVRGWNELMHLMSSAWRPPAAPARHREVQSKGRASQRGYQLPLSSQCYAAWAQYLVTFGGWSLSRIQLPSGMHVHPTPLKTLTQVTLSTEPSFGKLAVQITRLGEEVVSLIGPDYTGPYRPWKGG